MREPNIDSVSIDKPTPEDKKELTEKVIKLKESVLEFFKQEGFFMPMFFIETKESDKLYSVEIDPENMKDQKSKDYLSSELRRVIKDIRNKEKETILNTVFVAEVSMRKFEHSEKELMKKALEEGISDLKDINEGLMFCIETQDNMRVLFYDIITAKDGFVVSPEPLNDLYSSKNKGTKEETIMSRFRLW